MLTVLNDVHLGAIRSAGTTLTTQWELRRHLQTRFKALLPTSGDLMILGDLFDAVNIPVIDVLECYFALKAWAAANPVSTCWLVSGNHDLSKSSNVMSSFDFLCALVSDSISTIKPVKSPTMTRYGYVIPHLPSQVLFDEALSAVPACAVLYLHCNYNNNFSAQSDQSLNLSKDQADALPAASIVIAHEHKARRIGKVFIPGNQVSSSCSDWIGQRIKMFATVTDNTVTLNPLPDTQEFLEPDWESLTVTDHKFIRVTGTATALQAAAVVTAISKFRQASPALVITNGVSITQAEGSAEVFGNALHDAQAFSVMAALRELMTPEEMTILEALNA